jgi:methionine-rich copper-binding protein CopC
MFAGRLVRSTVALSFLSVAALAFAPPAAMHTHLTKSAPGANDSVAPPKALTFWFSERVELPFTRVSLKNIAGVAQPLGAPGFANDSANAPVVVPVTGTLGAGEYTVTWSAAAKDGHPAKGTFKFYVVVRRQ